MSFFSSLRNSLGLSKSRKESKGHRLGDGAEEASLLPTNSAEDPVGEYFTREFMADKLGMAMGEVSIKLPNDEYDEDGPRSRPAVVDINLNSEADQKGIELGDIIVTLSGYELQSFQEFFDIISALDRPLQIRFFRINKPTTSNSKTTQPLSSSSLNRPAAPVKGSVFSRISGSVTSAPPPAALTESELDARRQERIRAVQERSQKSSRKGGPTKSNNINSRSSSGPISPRVAGLTASKNAASEEDVNDHSTTLDPANLHPETLRVIQKTKELEVAVEQKLGYSPFRPHMSFSGNGSVNNAIGSNSSVIPPPSSSSGSGRQQPQMQATQQAPTLAAATTRLQEENEEEEEEPDDYMIGEVDDALALLLSLSDIEQEKAQVAVQTIQKMVNNLLHHRSDPKFRSIRISNKAFQSKVGSIPGGIELLQAAGYQEDKGGSSNNSSSVESEENFLLHPMDRYSERKLVYTAARLDELFAANNNNSNNNT